MSFTQYLLFHHVGTFKSWDLQSENDFIFKEDWIVSQSLTIMALADIFVSFQNPIMKAEYSITENRISNDNKKKYIK